MPIETLAREIRSTLSAHADPILAQKYARYFVEGYDAYGVNLNDLKTEIGDWLQGNRESMGLEGFLELGDELVHSGKYEEGMLAISLIKHFQTKFTPKTLQRLGEWLDNGLCNWAHADVFSGDVLSKFLEKKITNLDAFANWRGAESKWKRRSVPVTLISALKAGYMVNELLGFVEPMILDGEKVVQQGLGWFLREAWKNDPQQVEAFLLKWKDQFARLIIQYATEKMDKEKKAIFKKSK